jgi:hypothetical protein
MSGVYGSSFGSGLLEMAMLRTGYIEMGMVSFYLRVSLYFCVEAWLGFAAFSVIVWGYEIAAALRDDASCTVNL